MCQERTSTRPMSPLLCRRIYSRLGIFPETFTPHPSPNKSLLASPESNLSGDPLRAPFPCRRNSLFLHLPLAPTEGARAAATPSPRCLNVCQGIIKCMRIIERLVRPPLLLLRVSTFGVCLPVAVPSSSSGTGVPVE